MNVQEFIEKYVETKDDGHPFMPSDVKDDYKHSSKKERIEWIYESLDLKLDDAMQGGNTTSMAGTVEHEKITYEAYKDHEFFINNEAAVLKAAYEYIYEGDDDE